MGGIKPPPNYHQQLSRRFAKRLLLANALIVVIALALIKYFTVIQWVK